MTIDIALSDITLPWGCVTRRARARSPFAHPRRLARIVRAIAIGVVLSACQDRSVVTAPAGQTPAREILDGTHNQGNSHFFFLPPMVKSPQTNGTPDGTLQPNVSICEWKQTANSCGGVLAEFVTNAGTERVRYDAASASYQVNWKTTECIAGPCSLDPAKVYRVRVLVGGIELGHADVVTKGSDLLNTETQDYIGLQDGRTLPIKFRVETGAVSVVASGVPAQLDESGGQVTLNDGKVALDFPAGALTGETNVTVSLISSPGAGTGAWSPVVDLRPDGTTFAEPVTLGIQFTPAQLPPGIPASALTIMTWDGAGWVEVPGAEVDSTDNMVRAPIQHFSTYVINIAPNSVSGTPSPTTLVVGQQVSYSSHVFYYDVQQQTICFRSGCYVQSTPYHYPIPNAAVTWTSSNPQVAALSGSRTYTNASGNAPSPTITAVAPGGSNITATSNGVTASPLQLTVLSPLPPAIVYSKATAPGVGHLFTMAIDGSNSTQLTNVGSLNTEPAVSPDGQKIAWRSDRGGGNQIWVMNVNGTGAVQLTSCGYNSDPSWSPDGARIAYHSNCAGNDDIWIMNANGSGQTRVNSDPSSEGAPDWSPDGQWIAFTSNRLGHNDIWIMRPDGSLPRFVTNDAALDVYMSWSPDSRRIAHRCDSNICVSDAYSQTTSTLVTGGAGNDTPKWSRDGSTISFMRLLPNSGGTNIWKIPANGGTAIQLTPGGGNEGHPEWLGPAAAPPPAAYLYGRCDNGACDLLTVAENGAYAKVIFSDGALNVETAVSPNGQHMTWRAGDQIVVANIDGTGRTRLTTCGYNSDPSWSPDGQRIAYHSNCGGGDDLWIMNADGSNQTRIMNGPTTNGTPFWSPDGQWIAFSTNRTGPNDIWIVRPDGTDARPINSDPTLDTYPAWSPDSQQLVWTCGQSLCLGSINAVGANPIPNTGPFAENAYWGSDGLISFTRLDENGFNVWTIRPDGTGLRRLTLDNIGANHPLRLP